MKNVTKGTHRAVASLVLTACVVGAAGPSRAELIYGYGVNGQANVIFSFDSSSPQNVISSAPITGLSSGDRLQAIDIRPANGALYGFGDSNNVYVINPTTGLATIQSNVGPPSEGAQGIDFNPVPDRLRIVTSSDQNLRVNVDNGATTVDTNLVFAPGDPNAGRNPTIVGSGYTNSRGPSPRTTPGTTLYDIDSELNILTTQNPPNDGRLNTVGSLNVDIGTSAELDISGLSDTAYLSDLNGSTGVSSFYRVNLATGNASLIGNFNPAVGQVNGIAAPAPVPEPGTMALMGVGLASLVATRRRRKKDASRAS